MNGDRTSYDVWGAAIAVEAALSMLLCLVLVFIWGLTGAGYFWPKWVLFALAVPLAIQLAVRLALRVPDGRQRALALHGAASGWVAAVLIAVYALAGGGTFWPLWAVATLALALRRPRDRRRRRCRACARRSASSRPASTSSRAPAPAPSTCRRPSCGASSATCTTAPRRASSP